MKKTVGRRQKKEPSLDARVTAGAYNAWLQRKKLAKGTLGTMEAK